MILGVSQSLESWPLRPTDVGDWTACATFVAVKLLFRAALSAINEVEPPPITTLAIYAGHSDSEPIS